MADTDARATLAQTAVTLDRAVNRLALAEAGAARTLVADVRRELHAEADALLKLRATLPAADGEPSS